MQVFILLLLTLNIAQAKQGLTLDRLQKDTFKYFWETTDESTGLAPDRYPSPSPSSIAAIGFALTVYPVGVERKYISRQQAVQRTLATLRFLSKLPHGTAASGVAGYKGFFYHFLDMENGLRSQDWDVELSTIDTALLMAGVLFSQSYFDHPTPEENEIRRLADQLYRQVEWTWAQNNKPLISLGWFPDKGFIGYDWTGYNEAMLLYILALGSPTHPIEPGAWLEWTKTYDENWQEFQGVEHLNFAPLFGHQYSHVWIDFQGIQDPFMKEKNSTYFANSRKAAYAQRQYAISNPQKWKGYSKNQWGFTACDGPGEYQKSVNGKKRQFLGYHARGVATKFSFDDGTLAPTALGGSLPFAPEIILPALQTTYKKYGEHIYTKYGFLDSYNPSFQFKVESKSGKVVPGLGWFAKDYIGIDQGAILTMVENHRSQFIWKVMKGNPYIQKGLKRAGFTGGWLSE